MKKITFVGMTTEERLETVKALYDNGTIKKGAYMPIAFKSQKKALKAYEKEFGNTTIEKFSEGIVRVGIDYHKTATYLNKVVTAESSPNRTSPYDSPLSGYEDLIIKTEKDSEISYKIKLFASKTASKMRTKWFKNGVEVSENDLEGVMVKQSKSNPNDFIVFTIRLDNLISIGG